MKREIAPGYFAHDWESIFEFANTTDEHKLASAQQHARIHLEIALRTCGYTDNELRNNLPAVVEEVAATRTIPSSLTTQVTRALRGRNKSQHRGIDPIAAHVRNDVLAIHEFCSFLGSPHASSASGHSLTGGTSPPMHVSSVGLSSHSDSSSPNSKNTGSELRWWHVILALVGAYGISQGRAIEKERLLLGDAEYECRQAAKIRATAEALAAARKAAELENEKERTRRERLQALLAITALLCLAGLVFYNEEMHRTQESKQSIGESYVTIDGGVDSHFVDTTATGKTMESMEETERLETDRAEQIILHKIDASWVGTRGITFYKVCSAASANWHRFNKGERRQIREACMLYQGFSRDEFPATKSE